MYVRPCAVYRIIPTPLISSFFPSFGAEEKQNSISTGSSKIRERIFREICFHLDRRVEIERYFVKKRKGRRENGLGRNKFIVWGLNVLKRSRVESRSKVRRKGMRN